MVRWILLLLGLVGMTGGWVFAFSYIGIVLLFAGTVLTVSAVLIARDAPTAVLGFAFVLIGWVAPVVYISSRPASLVVLAAAIGIASFAVLRQIRTVQARS